MEFIEIISIVFVGLGALFLKWKKNFRFVPLINLLLTTLVILLFRKAVEPENFSQLYAVIALLGSNYVLSQVKSLQKFGVRLIGPLLSFSVYFFFFQSDTLTVLGDEYSSFNKFILAGVVLSIVSYEFGVLKKFFLDKMFKELDNADVVKSVMILFMAFAVFLGGFAAGSFGLLFVASAFISASFYRDDSSINYGVSFLALSVLAYLLTLTGETEVDLMSSDVLEGLLIGVFGAFFIGKLWSINNKLVLSLGYLIMIGLSLGLLFLHTLYAQMGGMDAYIGVIVGASIVNLVSGNAYVGQTIFSFLLVGGMLLPAAMLNEELENFEISVKSSNTIEGKKEVEEVVTLDLTELSGSYKIKPTSSSVSFYLGKKGETKGAFKTFSGKVFIDNKIDKSEFEINLDMNEFTTFNSFRDKSLRGADYFKTDKYPTMSYKSKTIINKGNNEYDIVGEFEMLGVKKELVVTLIRIQKEDKNVITGKGKIDRREFGMTPSATEGNIVTFEYEAELE